MILKYFEEIVRDIRQRSFFQPDDAHLGLNGGVLNIEHADMRNWKGGHDRFR